MNKDRITLTMGDEARTFTDAREAGIAYFQADARSIPTVWHGEPPMKLGAARTEGEYHDGSTRYVKDLPRANSEFAAQFKEGYVSQLRLAVDQDLWKTNWKDATPSNPAHVPHLAEPVMDRLAELTRHDYKAVLQSWMSRCKLAPSTYSMPAFMDPLWRYQMDGPSALEALKEVTGKILRSAAASRATPAEASKLSGQLNELSKNLAGISRAPAATGRPRTR